MTCASRCTGHCCKAFTLPFDMDDLNRQAQISGKGSELEYIAKMVIPLHSGSYEKMPDDIRDLLRGYSHVYTCKHFDGVNCTQYESRPPMCRDYPYGARCEYVGCTMK